MNARRSPACLNRLVLLQFQREGGAPYLWRISTGAREWSRGKTCTCHLTGTDVGKKQVVLSQAWYCSFPVTAMVFPSLPSEPANADPEFISTSWLMRKVPSYTGTRSLIAGR